MEIFHIFRRIANVYVILVDTLAIIDSTRYTRVHLFHHLHLQENCRRIEYLRNVEQTTEINFKMNETWMTWHSGALT